MIKRGLDILLSLIAILILSPLLILVMIMLKFTGEGYIFYMQKRVGLDGKLFDLLKFPTMFKNRSNMAGGNITSKTILEFFLSAVFYADIKSMNYSRL